ncbi:unnamed protein product, partial [Symbiodinium pilosum]
ANKTVLLYDLPPFTNRSTLEGNVKHYLQGAGLDYSQVAAVHNHLLTSASAVVRVEFLTENQARTFHIHMRASKRYWRVPGTQDTKVRSELDTTTEDRIAMQPFYALLDILSELTGSPDLQTWKQTLQIWTGKDVTPKRLLAQVSYVLDSRFPRRYACCRSGARLFPIACAARCCSYKPSAAQSRLVQDPPPPDMAKVRPIFGQKIGIWAARADIAHSPVMPWDILIASSFRLAYEHAQMESSTEPQPLQWHQDVFPWLMICSFERVATDLFQTLAEDLADFLDQDDTLMKLIAGESTLDSEFRDEKETDGRMQ